MFLSLFSLSLSFFFFFSLNYFHQSVRLCTICHSLLTQGMGGQFDYFGFWVDHTFNKGHSKAEPRCTTYGSPQLSKSPEFEVDILEVWVVGPQKKKEDEYDAEELSEEVQYVCLYVDLLAHPSVSLSACIFVVRVV